MKLASFVRGIYAAAASIVATMAYVYGLSGGQCQPAFDWRRALDGLIIFISPNPLLWSFVIFLSVIVFLESDSVVVSKKLFLQALAVMFALAFAIACISSRIPCVSLNS